MVLLFFVHLIMFLTQVDPKTGLLDISNERDGILCIKAFRDVINDKKLGLECMTAIALTIDYETPWRHYSILERPVKAMEEITGNRNAFSWPQEKIQVALKKYDELQFDPVLQEGVIHENRKRNKLREIEDSERDLEKETPTSLFADLRAINKDVEFYKASIAGKDLYENAPSKNGYTLSRLEQLVEKKNSFYSQVR